MASSGVLSELLPFLLSGGGLVLSRAGVCHVPGGECGRGCHVLQSVPHPSSPLWLPSLPSVLPENSPLTRPRAAAPLSFTHQLSVCLCVTYKLQCISWHTSSGHTLTTVHHFLTLFEYFHYFDWTGFLLPLAELRCFFPVFKSLSLGSLPHIWIVDSFLQPGHLCLLIYEPNLLTN